MSRTRRAGTVIGLLVAVGVVAALVLVARRRGMRPTAAGALALAREGADRAVATWRGLVGGERVTDDDLERLFGEQPQA